MHNKYMLFSSNAIYPAAVIKNILDSHTMGVDSATTISDFDTILHKWKYEVVALAIVNNKGYYYEDLVKYSMGVKDETVIPMQVTMSREEVEDSRKPLYDSLTMYDAVGKVIYPIMAPACKVMDFAEYIKYRFDLPVYNNLQLKQLNNCPENYIRELENGKYKLIGNIPMAIYYTGYSIMTYKEITEELSLEFKGELGTSTQPAINFPPTVFCKGGHHHNNPIDQHSTTIINSLGYTIDVSEWKKFIADIMAEYEKLVLKLEYRTYWEVSQKQFKKLLPKYPKLNDWINRLLAKGHDVYGYGNNLQILPFVHLSDVEGMYSNNFTDITHDLPCNCTSFVYLKDYDEEHIQSRPYTLRNRPNFLNRLAMYRKEPDVMKHFTIVRYY